MPLEGSIDDKNKALYERLIALGAKIEFEIDSKATSWRMQELAVYRIGAPDATPDPAAMAHELLHVELSLKGFWTPLAIYRYFNEKNSICSLQFINFLDNDLAHFKMLDNFIAMGFTVDDFLKDTPKDYYLNGIVYQIPAMIIYHNGGIANIIDQTREIVRLVGGAKLFELYYLKDPATKVGLHPSAIIDPLKEINAALIAKLEYLFDEWYQTNTVNNLQFYERMDAVLKEEKIPNAG